MPTPTERADPTPKPPPRRLPGGRWTVLQFPDGAPAPTIAGLVLELVNHRAAARPPRARWVASLGAFFMGEGRPVLLLSPDLGAWLLDELALLIEVLGPVQVRRRDRASLAFRGKTLVWLEDGGQ
jgi:hypothetical protein